MCDEAEFVFLEDIMRRTGKSRATLYAAAKEGTWPPFGNTVGKNACMLESELRRMQALLLVNAGDDDMRRLTATIVAEREKRARDAFRPLGEGDPPAPAPAN